MPKRETATKPSSKPESFESQLALLERIVRELERGDLPLERSLELFERGVRLSRECQERLNEAERRIEVLLADGPQGRTTVVGAFDLEAVSRSEDDDGEAEDDDETVF